MKTFRQFSESAGEEKHPLHQMVDDMNREMAAPGKKLLDYKGMEKSHGTETHTIHGNDFFIDQLCDRLGQSRRVKNKYPEPIAFNDPSSDDGHITVHKMEHKEGGTGMSKHLFMVHRSFGSRLN